MKCNGSRNISYKNMPYCNYISVTYFFIHQSKSLYCSRDQCMAHVPCVALCGPKSGTWIFLQMNQIYFLLKSSAFWDVTVHSPLKVSRCFGGISCIHPQGWDIRQAGSKQKLTWNDSLDSEVHHISVLEKVAHGKVEAECHWNNT